MRAHLDHIEKLTPDIWTYWFRPEMPLGQVAGEFTEVYLPHPRADTRSDKRWFTISSSPTESLVGITTKLDAGNGSTFKRALRTLRRGDTVQLAAPMGDFVLPKDVSIPLVFVAGGMGITPVRSIIRFLSDKHEQRDIYLFRSVTNKSEEIFAEEIEHYPLTYHLFDTSTGQRLKATDIVPILKNNSLLYLSGPERLVSQLTAETEQYGVSKHRIVADLFPGYDSL